jgi:hypothetical protein
MLQTTLYLTQDLAQQIERLSLTTGQPKARILRDAIGRGLRTIQAPPSQSAQALWQLTQAVHQQLHDEALPSDLAARHDAYLWDNT